MMHAAQETVRGADEGLGPEWDGVYRRLFLEFCPLGSLEDLLDKRISESVPVQWWGLLGL